MTCHREPPKLTEYECFKGRWPCVETDDFCGEHKPDPAPAPDVASVGGGSDG